MMVLLGQRYQHLYLEIKVQEQVAVLNLLV
jgi:hypothetical protein